MCTTLGRSSRNRFVTENNSERFPMAAISNEVLPPPPPTTTLWRCVLGKSREIGEEAIDGGAGGITREWLRGECGGESTSSSEELDRDLDLRSS